MAKINVVTPTNLGKTIKKDEATKKFEVNVDNSTITVNEQGQLVATVSNTATNDSTVWEGNVNLSNDTQLTLRKDCRGKTLHFFLMERENDNINNVNSEVLVMSMVIPEKTFNLDSELSILGNSFLHTNEDRYGITALVCRPIKDSLGTKIIVRDGYGYFCKLITMD